MNISIRTVSGTALVVISRALVGSRESIDAIQRVERELIERPETQVVLNLAAVPQINSTGLGMLIALAQKTVRHGG
ncbi:MAG: hypothetical protein HKN21_10595 [Candidatus Eisenbacteria bacterium]|uniref:STAS domain-containing protein n=1 Tax=Eiseniibacteriota bacterium TaxID=2212470 RepID=A0A7Y2EA04_UNCEI|nr:hypothetical protein [Candidatus Eisenbacteria bacterium]